MKLDNAHEFAIFVDKHTISVEKRTHNLTLNDSDTIKRIVSILRLKIGEPIILFDQKMSYGCTIDEISKKHMLLSIRNQHAIEAPTPQLDVVIPLLERDALEDTVSMATVYGANTIYLIATQKSRKTVTAKEHERLHKIAVAAAEQSKQFYIPTISPVLSLEEFIDTKMAPYKNSKKLWCDIKGKSILETLAQAKSYDSYLLTFGPEGDFTHKEKEELSNFFVPVKLTQTVLRAKDAAHLAMGIVRSHVQKS